MARKLKYNKEQVQSAIHSSKNFTQAARVLFGNNNTKSIRWYVCKYNIDISHFDKPVRRNIEHYLCHPPKSKIANDKLKRKLLSCGIFQHKCYECELTHWKNQPIPIQLHHKDGNPSNNCIDNIIFLCPNCHALTPNFCHKKQEKRGRSITELEIVDAIPKYINIRQLCLAIGLHPVAHTYDRVRRIIHKYSLQLGSDLES